MKSTATAMLCLHCLVMLGVGYVSGIPVWERTEADQPTGVTSDRRPARPLTGDDGNVGLRDIGAGTTAVSPGRNAVLRFARAGVVAGISTRGRGSWKTRPDGIRRRRSHREPRK